MPWWAWVLTLIAGGGLLYWLLVLTEGAYLGPGVVSWLYDRYASRYDHVKQFKDEDEAHFLGRPLADLQRGLGRPLHLVDLATGTGRLPLAALKATHGQCQVVAVDRSPGMLRQAAAKLAPWGDAVLLLEHDPVSLPFDDASFDVATCLEALEFLPDPQAALRELLRLLRPGGLLLVSNRIGWQARWMPGKAFPPASFPTLLEALGAAEARSQPWQFDYDLVVARKPGRLPAGLPND